VARKVYTIDDVSDDAHVVYDEESSLNETYGTEMQKMKRRRRGC